MHLLVLLAATVAALGVIAVIVVAAQVAEEARRAGRELGRFGELQPALVDLRRSTAEAHAAACALRRR